MKHAGQKRKGEKIPTITHWWSTMERREEGGKG